MAQKNDARAAEIEKEINPRFGVSVGVVNNGVDDKTNVIVALRYRDGSASSQRVGDLKKGASWNRTIGNAPTIGVSIAWTDAHGVPRLINLPSDALSTDHYSVSFGWRSGFSGGEILDIRW